MGLLFQLAGSPPLPHPKSISGCYVWVNQFAPVLPHARAYIPSIWIRPVLWLTHVLSYLGVEEVDKEAFQIGDSPLWKGRVDFRIPRRVTGRQPIELSVYGKPAMDALLAEKYVVVKALELLADAGYVFLTYSSMVMQYMAEEALYCNVEHLCLTKAQHNTLCAIADSCWYTPLHANSVSQVPDGSMTYAGCSFEAIFDQCMRQCGYTWEYAPQSPLLTTNGYQAKLRATKTGSAGGLSLIVLGRPCRRAAEAVESVLCTTFSFINDDCGYRIGDLHYSDLMLLCFRRQNPGFLTD